MPRGRRAAQAAQPSPVATVVTQPATRSAHSRNPPDNDGESFDMENISESDASDKDQANLQARPGRAHSEPAANAFNIQVNDPTPMPKKGTTALDIDFFYDRQKGRETFCKECK